MSLSLNILYCIGVCSANIGERSYLRMAIVLHQSRDVSQFGRHTDSPVVLLKALSQLGRCAELLWRAWLT